MTRRPPVAHLVVLAATVTLSFFLVGGGIASSDTTTTTTPATTTTSTTTSTTTTTLAPPTTTTTLKPKPKPKPKPLHYPDLVIGDHAKIVLKFQQKMVALGYWISPVDGDFGDSTQQAVFALQKAANIPADGVVGASTWRAWQLGVKPKVRPIKGNAVEVNLSKDLLLIVHNGKLRATINTSTGGGYTYTSDGVTSVAITPKGVYAIQRVVDGIVTDSLGQLWRPRYFYEGFAIHGDSYVPSVPVSHGCVRVSNEAINWIWATNQLPIGMKVWVYS
ncbi:MAG: L,D-transpeptidase family protein [Acidimicrobiales bacterium]